MNCACPRGRGAYITAHLNPFPPMRLPLLFILALSLHPFAAPAEDSTGEAPKKESSEDGVARNLRARQVHFDEAMLLIYDKNSDGKLDDAETDRMKADLAAHRTSFIKKNDKNGDGKLDADEMDAVRKQIREGHAALVRKFDKDGDGKLNPEEAAALREEIETRRADFRKSFDRINEAKDAAPPK